MHIQDTCVPPIMYITSNAYVHMYNYINVSVLDNEHMLVLTCIIIHVTVNVHIYDVNMVLI
jgi:hypothetical protein